MVKRKSLSKKLRFEVFKRDSFTCQYCGRTAPDAILQADHIMPASKGGGDDLTNLVTSCRDCNLGKSNRLLSDDAAVKQRKKQLDDLQERREQLEMMMDWQRGLLDIDEMATTELSSLWSDLVPGYSLNERGLQSFRKMARKYELVEIIEAMKVSTSQYLRFEKIPDSNTERPTQKSVEKACSYIDRIIRSKRRMADKPYLSQLYYCRGILRNRLHYLNEWQSIQLMEDAYLAGKSLDEIQMYTTETQNWSAFKEKMIDWARS